ncbi:MAG: hypothetical protein OXG35_13455 [Acidobacteria bacterium]|nr:hypothetical protein [Acidobacteriota bacterium]
MTTSPSDLKRHENEWLRFTETERTGRKTRIVECVNRRSEETIARIAWYGPWRQYCFFPSGETVFNCACMSAIAAALRTLTTSHRAAAMARRTEQRGPKPQRTPEDR